MGGLYLKKKVTTHKLCAEKRIEYREEYLYLKRPEKAWGKVGHKVSKLSFT